jgi:hypothetical protein
MRFSISVNFFSQKLINFPFCQIFRKNFHLHSKTICPVKNTTSIIIFHKTKFHTLQHHQPDEIIKFPPTVHHARIKAENNDEIQLFLLRAVQSPLHHTTNRRYRSGSLIRTRRTSTSKAQW